MFALPLALAAACLTLAADPSKPVVEEVVSVSYPSGWRVYIRSDGSANLRYGTDNGNGYTVPAGTFDAEAVRKALDEAKSDPKEKVRNGSHFQYWFEADRKKAPTKAPPMRYTQDEKLIVPLFEKAAAASNLTDTPRGKELLKDKPFGLPAEATRKSVIGFHTPGGWMLDIRNDGSAQLVFGDGGPGDTCTAPAGTFKPDAVRKSLDGLTFDPKGGGSSHFVVWYEDERKAADDGPPAKYTSDEKVIVPLFEAAADAGKFKDTRLGGQRLGAKPFGLK